MSRYKLILEYDGTNLIGWQENEQGPSVQSLLKNAIFKFSRVPSSVVAAGRTDSGVHAMGMIAHFDLPDTDTPHSGDTVMKALNFYLKNAPVSVLQCDVVQDDFHARFSCVRRHYKYIILNRSAPTVLDAQRVWWIPRQLDIEKMRIAAVKLIGHHDFTSFRASECQSKSPMKTLDSIDISVRPASNGSYIEINVSARSFLHHQVRNIVGTLVEIGLGKAMDIDAVLAARNRSAAGPTAPAAGLYFISADY